MANFLSGGGSDLGSLMAGTGGPLGGSPTAQPWWQQILANPAFQVSLDKAGQSIGGPATPFGGVATQGAQSNIAAQREQEITGNRNEMIKNLITMMGGGSSALGGISGPVREATPGLTPGHATGKNKVTTKLDAQGNTVKTTEEVIATPSGTVGPNQGQLSDFMGP